MLPLTSNTTTRSMGARSRRWASLRRVGALMLTRIENDGGYGGDGGGSHWRRLRPC